MGKCSHFCTSLFTWYALLASLQCTNVLCADWQPEEEQITSSRIATGQWSHDSHLEAQPDIQIRHPEDAAAIAINFQPPKFIAGTATFFECNIWGLVRGVKYRLAITLVVKSASKGDTTFRADWPLDDFQPHYMFNATIPALSTADLNCPEDCMPMLAAPSARIRVSIFDQFPGLSEEESLVAYTVDKKVETHGEQEARAVDESSLKNGSVSLRFFVMTRARSGSSAQSGSAGGGAVVLEELVYQLRENGHEASLLHADSVEAFWFVPQRAPHHVRCGGNKPDMKHAVIIYPEVLPLLCKDALIHVRWVLAPMGVHAEKDTTTHWGQDDMVFHFNGFGGPFYHHVGKISAISVPPSNALQVLRDPRAGDGFDITKYPPLPRNGTAYTALCERASSCMETICQGCMRPEIH